jgi:ABC-type dipeptide/oligopeptide/nickel transport system permease component
MLKLIVRRLAVLPVILLAVATLTFALTEISPFDPVRAYVGAETNLSPQRRAEIAHAYGFDQPVHESALSFLGLGLEPHRASLGNILADGQRSLLAGGWWIALFPGLVILLASMTIGTLAEYWREQLHPRWRSELEL